MISAGYGYALGLSNSNGQHAGHALDQFGIGYTFH